MGTIESIVQKIKQSIANTYAMLYAMGADAPADETSDNLASTAGTVKVVQYNEQTLTEEQKAQARENIGGQSKISGEEGQLVGFNSDGDPIPIDMDDSGDTDFYAIYGTTTNAEIEEAYAAGKKLYCLIDDAICPLYQRYAETMHCFYRGGFYIYCLNDAWSEDTPYEVNTNKTTAVSSSSTDEQYPSAKAVHTALNNCVPKSGATMEGALVAQNNADYTVGQVRNVFEVANGASLPTGSNGDICVVYTP